MRFNPKARLDTSRTRDAGRSRGGGSGGGRGAGFPIPGGARAGGGIGGIIVLVLIYVISQSVGGSDSGSGLSGSSYDTARMADTQRYSACQTGADANGSADCARVAVENSLVDFWSTTLPEQSSTGFSPEQALVTFSGSASTGCGAASSDVGPFYCPTDQTIYLDSTFFDQVLEQQLGGPDGGFVEAYVLAHEYGHHIQNLLGTMSQVRTQQGPQSDSVRLELQADCYAGMWAKSATTTQDADGNVLISELTDQDIKLALEAAASVGDDRIQQKTQGQVDEETWTHGSASSRERWFRTGLSQGSLKACDTFATNNL